ncbi:hypothetical protein NVS47_03945 [Dehalobacterium formicoaceticum]|uniref:Uncharacterized protein n=1 Tax=Dehalobacterium formicoaceticum TaxID=51515 RepID=A0ABT1Y432_9FIRM|nr:hypothetical protein [Dehalobacterium formicoaceticum]MCR6544674.1 hypothetical protein [Dehalobacterium formicoaceticum]
MLIATASIKAGICGFVTNISVDCASMFEPAYVKIDTNCEKIEKFSQTVQEVTPMKEITEGFEGQIMSEARKFLTA